MSICRIMIFSAVLCFLTENIYLCTVKYKNYSCGKAFAFIVILLLANLKILINNLSRSPNLFPFTQISLVSFAQLTVANATQFQTSVGNTMEVKRRKRVFETTKFGILSKGSLYPLLYCTQVLPRKSHPCNRTPLELST